MRYLVVGGTLSTRVALRLSARVWVARGTDKLVGGATVASERGPGGRAACR